MDGPIYVLCESYQKLICKTWSFSVPSEIARRPKCGKRAVGLPSPGLQCMN